MGDFTQLAFGDGDERQEGDGGLGGYTSNVPLRQIRQGTVGGYGGGYWGGAAGYLATNGGQYGGYKAGYTGKPIETAAGYSHQQQGVGAYGGYYAGYATPAAGYATPTAGYAGYGVAGYGGYAAAGDAAAAGHAGYAAAPAGYAAAPAGYAAAPGYAGYAAAPGYAGYAAAPGYAGYAGYQGGGSAGYAGYATPTYPEAANPRPKPPRGKDALNENQKLRLLVRNLGKAVREYAAEQDGKCIRRRRPKRDTDSKRRVKCRDSDTDTTDNDNADNDNTDNDKEHNSNYYKDGAVASGPCPAFYHVKGGLVDPGEGKWLPVPGTSDEYVVCPTNAAQHSEPAIVVCSNDPDYPTADGREPRKTALILRFGGDNNINYTHLRGHDGGAVNTYPLEFSNTRKGGSLRQTTKPSGTGDTCSRYVTLDDNTADDIGAAHIIPAPIVELPRGRRCIPLPPALDVVVDAPYRDLSDFSWATSELDGRGRRNARSGQRQRQSHKSRASTRRRRRRQRERRSTPTPDTRNHNQNLQNDLQSLKKRLREMLGDEGLKAEAASFDRIRSSGTLRGMPTSNA